MRVDGNLYDIEDVPPLDKKFRHNIDAVVDRIVVREGIESRLADSLQTALALADGIAVLETVSASDTPERIVFSEKFACPVSGFTIPEIEPRLFSFNAPYGACPACDGLGEESYFDPDLVVPNPRLSLTEGAVAPLARSDSAYVGQLFRSLAKHYQVSVSEPWEQIPAGVRHAILHGSGKDRIAVPVCRWGGIEAGAPPVRGRAAQSRAPLSGNRFGLEAGGFPALSRKPSLCGMPGISTQAGGPQRACRWIAYRRGDRNECHRGRCLGRGN